MEDDDPPGANFLRFASIVGGIKGRFPFPSELMSFTAGLLRGGVTDSKTVSSAEDAIVSVCCKEAISATTVDSGGGGQVMGDSPKTFRED